MKNWPFTVFDEVTHIGYLSAEEERAGMSFEAHLTSVSVHPDDWRSIARLGGVPEITLTREGSLFVDAHAIDEDQKEAILEWGLLQGFLEKRDLWKSWSFDEEGDPMYSLHSSEEAAWYEVEDEDAEGPEPGSPPVEPFKSHVLREAGQMALPRWGLPEAGYQACLILFSEQVIAATNPDVMGIWWEDDYDPDRLSCPRGGIFPDRLHHFERHMEPDGELEI